MARLVFGETTLEDLELDSAERERELARNEAVDLPFGGLIRIGQGDNFYRVDVLCRCDDGVVLHATALGANPVSDTSACFLKAAAHTKE